jgi:hypothetical protein
MSKRYKLLVILIETIKRLSIPYRIIGSSEPQDRNSVVVLGNHPRSIFLTVTNDGIEVTESFLSMYEEMLRADIIASVVMAAASVRISDND